MNVSFKRNVLVLKYSFEENYELVIHKIVIKDAFDFTLVAVIVLEISGKLTCFIDSKKLFVISETMPFEFSKKLPSGYVKMHASSVYR